MKTKNIFFFAVLACLSITSCAISKPAGTTTTSEPEVTSTTTTSEEETSTSIPSSVEQTYTVTWMDEDGKTKLEIDPNVRKGETPTYDNGTPTKDEDKRYTYEFSGWEPEIAPVQGDVTYTATYKAVEKTFTIIWKNSDGTVLETEENVKYGSTPSYKGEDPTKDATDGMRYDFDGWEPAFVKVEKNATYTAKYKEVKTKFNVTWVDEDGTELEADTGLAKGDIPSFDGEDPSKEEDKQYSYEFIGWTPEVSAIVDQDVTYTATYRSVEKKYTITWLDEDGTELDSEQLAYGATPSHTAPTKADDETYTYPFDKWTPTITKVTGDATYTAKYKTQKLNFPDTIYFSNNKGWGVPYVYAWNSDTDRKADWPGTAMTFYKINEQKEYVYSVSGISGYKNIIFNNGGNGEQTVDISSNDLPNTDNAFYLDTKNSEGKYKAKSWYESGVLPDKPSYEFKDKGQNILHCFDWPLATIMANLDDIAAQGFTAIQTSPLQPVKDFSDSANDTHNDRWWRFYQPVGLCIGSSSSNNLFSSTDGAAELSALTEAAARRGIRIIVDVIVNHLADGNGNGGLNVAVNTYSPEIYTNYNQTLHNPTYHYDVNYGTIEGLVRSDAFGKDLNTANSTVQTSVYNFLKSLADCNVTGFRFDAAKHIETSNEGYGYNSNFWEKTLSKIKSESSNTIWAYGEVLNPGDAGRNPQQYLDHSDFNAITAPMGWWDKTQAEHKWKTLDASRCVYWGESHDDYMGDEKKTRNTGQDVINSSYKDYALNNKDLNMLYFVRPELDKKIKGSTSVGYRPDWGWKNGQVLIANSR